MARRPDFRRGFTLVELLVVIAIIGILVVLLLPAVQAAREAARRMQCSNHLKQIALSVHNYHDTYKTFPIGHVWLDRFGRRNGATGWGWSAMILPFIEQSGVHDQIDFDLPPVDPGNTSPAQLRNEQVVGSPISISRCPSDLAPPTFRTSYGGKTVPVACSSYSGAAGSFDPSINGNNGVRTNGVMFRARGNAGNAMKTVGFRDILDGTTNQILLAETAYLLSSTNQAGPQGGRKRWYATQSGGQVRAGNSTRLLSEGFVRMNPPKSASSRFRRRAASSQHPGGAMFALADGSVRFISETVEHTGRPWNANDPYSSASGSAGYGTYQRLWSINDGLALGDF